MTKLDTLKTLIEYGNFKPAELTELMRWLIQRQAQNPTNFAISVLQAKTDRVTSIIDEAETPDQLQFFVLEDQYVSDDIREMCESWCLELVDWDAVYKKVVEQ